VRYKRSETWSASESRQFLATASTDGYSPLWLLALTTGMRRGELLGLRWQDVDFEHRALHVRQSVVALNGAAHIQEPKTSAARRTVKLPAEALAALKTHRTRQREKQLIAGPLWRDLDLVLTTPDGGPINPNNVLRNFYLLITKAKVPRIRFHDMRHTHATLLLAGGQPVKVVSERLGHAKTSITMDTYAHVLPDMQDAAVDAVSAMFFMPAEVTGT